uniref:Cytochrome P450 2G1-like n=1 Tax=Geotrypetes seraphini TaxID=260995 RepID=A0A6P8Q2K2_GEOSA|nr:cytochrome P450 2G1-like [Geotrypetes seraphini]
MFRNSKLPPGPTSFPIVGNLFQLKSGDIVQSFTKLYKKYGPAFTVYLGNRPLVVLCGYKAVKEALIDQGEDFYERGRMPAFEKINQGSGVTFLKGEKWKQIHTFLLMTLRDLGMGKKNFEELMTEEAQCLVEEIRNTKKLPVNPSSYLIQASANIITSIALGTRFDYGDKEWITILADMNKCFRIMGSFWGQLYDLIPEVMCYLPGPHNQMFKCMEGLTNFVTKRVKLKHETLDPSCPLNFSDYFLIRMEQEKQNPCSQFNEKSLSMNILQLYIGGVETIGSTLKYGLLFLLKYPEIEEKVHKEIDSVVRRSCLPSIEDRRKLHYTNAVIHEIQRLGDIVPLAGTHEVVRDTPFREYIIPKGTNVCVFLSSVLSDSKYFSDPWNFNPGHFLDENGYFKANEAFIPFSMGKRKCLGESLARMELYLFLTAILQNFSLKSDLEPKEINLTPVSKGFETVPPSYEVHFLPR